MVKWGSAAGASALFNLFNLFNPFNLFNSRFRCSLCGEQLLPNAFVQEDFLEKLLTFFSLRGLVRVDGQPQPEGGPLLFLASRFNFAPVVMDDKITSHKVDAVLHRAVATHHKRVE